MRAHNSKHGIQGSLLDLTDEDERGEAVASVWVVPVLRMLVTATANPIHHNKNNCQYSADSDPNIKWSVVEKLWFNSVSFVDIS